MSLPPALAAAASAQNRAFARPQALAAGLDDADIRALTRSGEWVRLRRGVYAAAADLPDDPQQRWATACRARLLGLEGDVFVSHLAAARLLGHRTLGEVRLVETTRHEQPGAPLWHASSSERTFSRVPPHHRDAALGVPVTSLARTVVDVARRHGLRQGLVVADSALRDIGRAELRAVADELDRWPGLAIARQAIGFADALAESALESLARLMAHELKLPRPRLQVVIRDGAFAARVDFLFEHERTVLETDGRLKYDDQGAARWAEKRREDRLRELGFEVVRLTWADVVHRPQEAGARLRAAFARAARRRAVLL